MRLLKLMADYECFPLWELSENVGNVDPDSLQISARLKADLMAWAELFDKTLNYDDPVRSGFSSTDEEDRFKEQGRLLGERLQAELGVTAKVSVCV